MSVCVLAILDQNECVMSYDFAQNSVDLTVPTHQVDECFLHGETNLCTLVGESVRLL